MLIEEEADRNLNFQVPAIDGLAGDYHPHPETKVSLVKGRGGVPIYPRDPKQGAIALKRADYQCEFDTGHICFARKNGLPYTEVHHLIPLAFHEKFSNSLDVPANIVSLCSSCHNEIHYGKDAKRLIDRLFESRKAGLAQAGLEITKERLLSMYKEE